MWLHEIKGENIKDIYYKSENFKIAELYCRGLQFFLSNFW